MPFSAYQLAKIVLTLIFYILMLLKLVFTYVIWGIIHFCDDHISWLIDNSPSRIFPLRKEADLNGDKLT